TWADGFPLLAWRIVEQFARDPRIRIDRGKRHLTVRQQPCGVEKTGFIRHFAGHFPFASYGVIKFCVETKVMILIPTSSNQYQSVREQCSRVEAANELHGSSSGPMFRFW